MNNQPQEPAKSPDGPAAWLLEAARRLPFMSFAIGVVGVVAAAAISLGFFLGNWLPALYSGITALLAMVLLRVYAKSRPKEEPISIALPAQVLIWTAVLSLVVVVVLGLVRLAIYLFPGDNTPSGITLPGLLDKTYGPQPSAERATALRDIRAHLAAFSEVQTPITGDRTSTKALTLPTHLSLFYQGDGWILKGQTYPVPTGAKRISALAIADNPDRDNQIQTRVFARSGEATYRSITPIRSDSRDLFPLDRAREVVIFTIYPGARMFVEKKNTEQIVLEVDDLSGLISKMEIAVGGRVSECVFRSIFAFQASANGPIAYEVGDGNSITVSAESILARLRPAARVASESAAGWPKFAEYWNQIESTAGGAQYAMLELAAIKNDLLVHTTGNYIGQSP